MKKCCESAVKADNDESAKNNAIFAGLLAGVLLIVLFGFAMFELHLKLNRIDDQNIKISSRLADLNYDVGLTKDYARRTFKMILETKDENK